MSPCPCNPVQICVSDAVSFSLMLPHQEPYFTLQIPVTIFGPGAGGPLSSSPSCRPPCKKHPFPLVSAQGGVWERVQHLSALG